MSRNASLILALLCPLPALGGTLAEALASFAGQEVEITGHIGTGLAMGDDEALTFRDSTGAAYPVVFDAGREARKKLAGCEFKLFTGGTPCPFTGKAEIALDGATVRLIIFEAGEIGAPGKLP